MKLVIDEAYISYVGNLGEEHGEEVVSGTAIKFSCSVTPKQLDAFDPEIRKVLFKDDIPAIEHLGECKWRATYEKATVEIAGQRFTKADVKKIVFEPKAGFLFDLAGMVKVNANEAQRGVLTGLVKQTIQIVIEKMTQKRIDDPADAGEEVGGEKKDEKQGDLNITPLLTEEKLNEAAGATTKH